MGRPSHNADDSCTTQKVIPAKKLVTLRVKKKVNKQERKSVAKQPAHVVGRKILRTHLDNVWHAAKATANQTGKDSDYVHQLRVATRSAGAALEVFSQFVRKRELRWMKNRLRRFRRAAGKARDLDVLASRLAAIVSDENDKPIKKLLKKLKKQRSKAQLPLVDEYLSAKRKRFRRRIETLVNGICRSNISFEQAARTAIEQSISKFFVAAESLPFDFTSLHRLRISAKRVRYSLEILKKAFAPALVKQTTREFRKLQEQLGPINDHVNTVATFSRILEGVKDDGSIQRFQLLIETEKQQLEEKRRSFCELLIPGKLAELKVLVRALVDEERKGEKRGQV